MGTQLESSQAAKVCRWDYINISGKYKARILADNCRSILNSNGGVLLTEQFDGTQSEFSNRDTGE